MQAKIFLHSLSYSQRYVKWAIAEWKLIDTNPFSKTVMNDDTNKFVYICLQTTLLLVKSQSKADE